MNNAERAEILPDIYELIADLWCSPSEANAEGENSREAGAQLVQRWATVDGESAGHLSRFLSDDAVSEEDYVELFELDPQCSLYLGSHSYDEPKTCANAGVSERNDYMIELVGLYKHFGRQPKSTELPDYMPLMTSFLSLTTDRKDDPIRQKFVSEYFLPYLGPMRSRLAELKTPYVHLLDALEKIIQVEGGTQPFPEQRTQKVEAYVE